MEWLTTGMRSISLGRKSIKQRVAAATHRVRDDGVDADRVGVEARSSSYRHGDCAGGMEREPQSYRARTSGGVTDRLGYLGKVRVGVLGEVLDGRVVVNERVVGQPFDRATAGSGVAEGVPGWQQLRELFV
jgi:hypothetical protein